MISSPRKIEYLKVEPSDERFIQLVKELDSYLAITDGEDHHFYNQYNQLDKIDAVILALYEGEVAACGALRKFEGKTVEIKRMYVRPPMRRKGLASGILTQLEELASTLGFDRCILETGINQKEALKLYPANGYQVIPNYGPYTHVEASTCMEKWL
ncbi:MAG: GNAT family N-acetyltransferase [Bacteroidota bacterium]